MQTMTSLSFEYRALSPAPPARVDLRPRTQTSTKGSNSYLGFVRVWSCAWRTTLACARPSIAACPLKGNADVFVERSH